MTLIVETPDTRAPERDYILGVVLGEFLGLPWRRVPADRVDTRITLEGQPGEIRLPDVLLSTQEPDWLQPASLPPRPLNQWDTAELGEDITLVERVIPVIYGDSAERVTPMPDEVRLPIDIFGSAFFMLTRYEELVVNDRDEHDRFPAWASLAYQEGFLERPIVDEYVEILWAAMQRLWPQLERKQREPCTFVTCDVDNPYAAYTKSMAATVRKMGGDVLKRRSVPEAIRTLRNTLATRRGDYRHDPFDTFDWMMDVNEAAGNRMAFYFLVDKSVPSMDGHYSIDEPRIRELIRRIHTRGHEIGLHGSYGTYRDADQMAKEAERLRQIMDEEGCVQDGVGIRQHYLRWDSAQTSRHVSAAGFRYDTTLSFADQAGFRCGTSQSYALFDLLGRHSLSLRERPLVLMECSVLSALYGGSEYTADTLTAMNRYKELCHRFGGEFVLLWHNSFFQHSSDPLFYQDLLDARRA
ncbi:polysaccharide deacetylase family protein [Thioalkalivibrio sp. ALJ15]|uniref:polysaccharide deacetylase family protein n=1 Tax=Thioalkalivibrio sp. ALJ15 TaxID=748652 RepID=UPI0003680AF7|nr:polysaccharide deacetylase family protein [Thioalkalivibrio sp. ALJ15]